MSLILCCRDATALLTEGSEDALRGAEAATFAFHLTICLRCKRYRSQLETTVGVLRSMPREEPAPADVDAVLKMLSDAAGKADE